MTLLSVALKRIVLVASLLILSFAAPDLAAQQLVAGEAYDVVLPPEFDSTKAYPLLIVLHGAQGTKESLQPYFIPDKQVSHYVRVFIQSNERSRGGYDWWNRLEDGRKVIRRSFDEVVANYRIDTSRVIVSGFSAGATMAIDVCEHAVVPVRGFIALCPGKPVEFDSNLVAGMTRRGLKGVILAGRGDYFHPYQIEMVDMFKSEGFEHLYFDLPNLGHGIPANLPKLLDAALHFVDPDVK